MKSFTTKLIYNFTISLGLLISGIGRFIQREARILEKRDWIIMGFISGFCDLGSDPLLT